MANTTREQFLAYVKVQRSGVTNMWDVKKVQQLSGLEEPTIMEIMKEYSYLAMKYELTKAEVK